MKSHRLGDCLLFNPRMISRFPNPIYHRFLFNSCLEDTIEKDVCIHRYMYFLIINIICFCCVQIPTFSEYKINSYKKELDIDYLNIFFLDLKCALSLNIFFFVIFVVHDFAKHIKEVALT